MNIGGVICELNPLHNGHTYLFRRIHEDGCAVIACMSGSFTQRGEAAVFDKYIRTQAALKAGADLVVELPVTYACAGAERFAFGGVYILQSLGCIQRLYCGSESADTRRILQTAQLLTEPAFSDTLHQYLRQGLTFASAREKAVQTLCGSDFSAILTQPNDILAVEYAKALWRLKSPIPLHTVQRIAAAHDSPVPNGQMASASYLREQLYHGQSVDVYIPPAVRELTAQAREQLPVSDRQQMMEPLLLYRLRTMTREDFAALPDISEGLENRLYDAVHSGHSTAEILSHVKSKRYTMARLRRILLYAFLQFTQEDFNVLPPYIQVLGFNAVGRDILHQAKKSAVLPFVTRHADIIGLSEESRRYDALSARCEDLYALTGRTVQPCGNAQRAKVIYENTLPSIFAADEYLQK